MTKYFIVTSRVSFSKRSRCERADLSLELVDDVLARVERPREKLASHPRIRNAADGRLGLVDRAGHDG